MNKVKDVSTFEAVSIINDSKDNKDLVVIDVRTKEEFDEYHIKGAVLIDIYKPDFSDRINKLEKNKRYIIYCRTGARSKYALELMRNLGFVEVYNLERGILDWKLRKLEVV
jgi:rhodanese-related sulfurtransferase